MTSAIAPINDKILDESGKLRPSWVVYFSELDRGDVGTTWSPPIVNLTVVGTPVISGVYYQNSGFTDFAIKIVPATNTSSTLGVTTCALPFSVVADSVANVVAGTGISFGVITASGRTLFLPTWTTIAVPITITGRVKN
jgi:hypothetical protein